MGAQGAREVFFYDGWFFHRLDELLDYVVEQAFDRWAGPAQENQISLLRNADDYPLACAIVDVWKLASSGGLFSEFGLETNDVALAVGRARRRLGMEWLQ